VFQIRRKSSCLQRVVSLRNDQQRETAFPAPFSYRLCIHPGILCSVKYAPRIFHSVPRQKFFPFRSFLKLPYRNLFSVLSPAPADNRKAFLYRREINISAVESTLRRKSRGHGGSHAFGYKQDLPVILKS